MKKWKIAAGALLALGALLVGYSAYLGAFNRIEVEIREVGPYNVFYRAQRGPYRQTQETLDAIGEIIRQAGHEPALGFGIYHDNPREVPQERLRSEAGYILASISADLATRLRGNGLFKHIPRRSYYVAEFPYRNRLSILLGIMRVYPRLMQAVEEREGPDQKKYSLEIYDFKNRKTIYMIPAPK